MPSAKRIVYIKDESFDPIYQTVNKDFSEKKNRTIPAMLFVIGMIILLTQVGIPLFFIKNFERTPKEVDSSVLGIATGFNEFEFKELVPTKYAKETDYSTTNVPKFFYLTIPKLNIENAVVETNSLNLSPEDKLGHYNGSSLPGEEGNAFIYGHSVLPWFYNPKNYKTIFSTLGELETGDKIIITYNNVDYTYTVEFSEVKKPKDINPLADYKPEYLNEDTITLMTCWPAGTKSKRYMVRAVNLD